MVAEMELWLFERSPRKEFVLHVWLHDGNALRLGSGTLDTLIVFFPNVLQRGQSKVFIKAACLWTS